MVLMVKGFAYVCGINVGLFACACMFYSERQKYGPEVSTWRHWGELQEWECEGELKVSQSRTQNRDMKYDGMLI